MWTSPAYSTGQAKLTYTLTSRLLFEGGYSRNLEYYTNQYQDRHRGAAILVGLVQQDRAERGRPQRLQRIGAANAQTTQSPAAYDQRFGVVRDRLAQHEGRDPADGGTFFHTADATATSSRSTRAQQQRRHGHAVDASRTVVVRNTPVRSGEALNYDLGIFAQDSWTLKRLTINAGLRYEKLNAQVLEGDSPAGRFVPERRFAAVEDLPNWRDWAPRFALVYDLFGNAKTASSTR